jgi:hypothetical protein
MNGSDMTMTTEHGKTKHVNISHDLRRIQSTFSGKEPLDSLKKNFVATAQQSPHAFQVKLVPRAHRLHRIDYVDVKLDKQTFLPQALTIEGSDGVTSVFTFDVTSVNAKLPAGTFDAPEAK